MNNCGDTNDLQNKAADFTLNTSAKRSIKKHDIFISERKNSYYIKSSQLMSNQYCNSIGWFLDNMTFFNEIYSKKTITHKKLDQILFPFHRGFHQLFHHIFFNILFDSFSSPRFLQLLLVHLLLSIAFFILLRKKMLFYNNLAYSFSCYSLSYFFRFYILVNNLLKHFANT